MLRKPSLTIRLPNSCPGPFTSQITNAGAPSALRNILARAWTYTANSWASMVLPVNCATFCPVRFSATEATELDDISPPFPVAMSHPMTYSAGCGLP